LIIPKNELKTQVLRFIDNKNRGISLRLFCELAGIDLRTLMDVFVREEYPMTEYVQIRVSKAYNSWKNGEVAVMEKRNRERFVTYRKEPKPALIRGYGLEVSDGKIKLNVGIKNRNDYSTPTLEEQLRG